MSPRPLAAASLAALVALACAPRADPRLVAQPVAARTWVSERHRDHPLVGKIWDGRAGRFTDEAALSAAISGADVVLLGEVHDNVDHHLLQARLLGTVLASGRRPALVLEMLTVDQQPVIDAALARAPRDADALAKAVDWKHSRWPDFSLYRPIFQAALDAGVPVIAGNLPRKVIREVVSKGAKGLEEPLRTRLAKDEPPPDVLEVMRTEMRDSHCGELPEVMLDPLVLAQRARDAQMSERVLSAGDRGAVLVAGKGHVRTDRGVPSYLRSDAPGRKVVAVGFVEVDPEATTPAEYHEEHEQGPLPYDFAVFTPGQERDDPCEPLRERSREREKAR